MLGKLGRGGVPTMKRTTSITRINVDVPWPLDSHQNPVSDGQVMTGSTWIDHRSPPAMISPRHRMRGSSDDHRRLELETPPFLRTCGLCSRRLAPARDIYMYRGDTAFCSEECREQRIKQDERKEKLMAKSKNIEISHHNHFDLTCCESSTNGETVAAAELNYYIKA